jgi:hypothetical protein
MHLCPICNANLLLDYNNNLYSDYICRIDSDHHLFMLRLSNNNNIVTVKSKLLDNIYFELSYLNNTTTIWQSCSKKIIIDQIIKINYSDFNLLYQKIMSYLLIA